MRNNSLQMWQEEAKLVAFTIATTGCW